MIITNVPSSKRRPGSYSQYKFVPSGQQLVALPLRVVAVGQGSTSATLAINTPVQISDEDDADDKAGQGSELALMLRKMLGQTAYLGASPEIWACRVENPAGNAAAHTITVSGTATASGTLAIRAAGRTLNVGVSQGDAAATVAAAIQAQWDLNAANLPGTAEAFGAIVTVTQTYPGVNGNDVSFATESGIAGLTIAYGVSQAGTGVADVSAALDALFDRDYDGIAIGNHAAADIADLGVHLGAAWGYSQQRPRHAFVGERGSLGTAQALATAGNDKAIIVVNAEQSGSLPSEIAAAGCVAWFSFEAPNVNMDGVKLLIHAPPAAYAFTDTEVETALAGGVTPLVPTPDGYMEIVMLVTTATTVNGQPFDGLKEAAKSRTAAYMARQIAARFAAEFHQENLTEEVIQRVRDMVIAVQRVTESAGYIRNVDDYLDQTKVEEAAAPDGRLNVTNPFRVAGPLHQAVFVHTMHL